MPHGMNRTKIEWTDWTFNPVTGCYGPGGTANNPRPCPYCYARGVARRFGRTDRARRFEPEFHPNRLDAPTRLKKPARIFVCSMADLFGDWVPREWIRNIIDVAYRSPRHTFQFLTKNPMRYQEFTFPPNAWLGATTVNQVAADRARYAISTMLHNNVVFFSAEPLLSPIRLTDAPDWVIVGAQTGPGGRQPERIWVEDLVGDARRAGAAVFIKDNLKWHERHHEFPKRKTR